MKNQNSITLLEYSDGMEYRAKRYELLKDKNYTYEFEEKDPSELYEEMNLNYIIDDEAVDVHINSRVGFFCYLFFEDLLNESLDYISKLPDICDIYIATDTEAKIRCIEKKCVNKGINDRVKIMLHNNKGRDVSAFLVLFNEVIRKYDIACFVHDKKSSQMRYPTVGKDFNTHIWKSLLHSKGYVENIIKTFEKEERLGMLVPSIVMHGEYYHTAIDAWTICYDKTVDLSKKLDLHVKIGGDNNPLALGTAFWFRPNALLKLFNYDLKYSTFPDEPLPIDGSISHCIERIFPYVALDAGYYTGVVFPKEIASNAILNQMTALNQIMRRLDRLKGVNAATLKSTLESLEGSYFQKKPIDPVFIDARYIDESEDYIKDFKRKYSLRNDYIFIRNQLIASTAHNHNLFIKAFAKKFRKRIVYELCLYKFQTVEVMLDAIEDYLKGPEHFYDVNHNYEYETPIKFFNDKEIDLKWYKHCAQIDDCDFVHSLIRMITINGNILKADRKIIVSPYAARIVQAYRASEIVFYDQDNGCGYTVQKDFSRLISLYRRYLSIRKRLLKNYLKTKRLYQIAHPELLTEESWVRMLDSLDMDYIESYKVR